MSVGTGVETSEAITGTGGLRLQLLGPLVLSRAGSLVVLPSSRKVRALLALPGAGRP
ncbi:hypothetical protein [Piscinibacter gummiphilus]|uniref:Uncharacterized protein n=1 Tax=Piscinibacter gummiphilus TaxID=946333 RepID=A0ABZ0CNQ1_9BURK|nr:hypothetical protein [Piscinibacter gummiphilus]WOB06604.1 hypothetical protein RXV79_16930 [Piscinibacter gummiphilus]